MHAGIEAENQTRASLFVACAAYPVMTVAARPVVLLKHDHTQTSIHKQRSGSEATDAGADHCDIVCLRIAARKIRMWPTISRISGRTAAKVDTNPERR